MGCRSNSPSAGLRTWVTRADRDSLRITAPESHQHPHVEAERASLFRAFEPGSTELEYLELLRALVRCVKPRIVLETGAWKGRGTIALAEALAENCVGKLVSLEADPHAAANVRAKLIDRGLHNAVVIAANSLDYLGSCTDRFELAFLDSSLSVRARELRRCLELRRLESGALIAIHDTSRTRTLPDGRPDPASARFWSEFETLRDEFALSQVLEFPLSRGLLLCRAT